MIFIEIAELKSRLNSQSINLIESPKTQKLFAVAMKNGTEEVALKVEQSIDTNLPVKFMYESAETFMEGCIVNVKPSNPPRHTW